MALKTRPRATPAPTTTDIVDVSPATGAATNTVRVSATRLRSGDAVTMGGASATITASSYGCYTSGGSYPYVDVTAPAHADGAVDVAVTGYHGNDTASGAFTYAAGAGLKTGLIQSDWPSTGTSSAILRDSAQWDSTILGQAGLAVIARPSADWPTTNVLEVTCLEANTGNQSLIKTGLGTLVAGDVLAYRWYQAVQLPGHDTLTDPETHPVQDRGGVNWKWHVYHNQGGAGSVTFKLFTSNSTVNPNNTYFAGPALTKGTIIRVEILFTLVTSTTFNINVRVYNKDNVLIASDANFVNEDAAGIDTLADQAAGQFNITNAARLDGFDLGCNGLAGSDWFPSLLFSYYAGVAICKNQGWIGAWGSVTGES